MRRYALIITIFLLSTALSSFEASGAAQCRHLFSESAISEANSWLQRKELQGLAPNSPHTILNLDKYLASKISLKAMQAITNDAPITLQLGPGRAQNKKLLSDSLSWERVENPEGAFDVLIVKKRNQNEEIIITNVNGQSRLIQILGLLKLSGAKTSNIQIKGHITDYTHNYLTTFKKIGHRPDLVVFGFANTSFEALAQLGQGSRWPQAKLQNEKYQKDKWTKPGPFHHELQNMGVQVLEFNHGKKVWLIDNEYGDRAGMILRALNQWGAHEVLFLGTTGSLRRTDKVGDIVSPREILLGADLKRHRLPDSHLNITTEGVHSHVDAIALETIVWRNKMISKGVSFVEVELKHVFENQGRAKVTPFLIVSDLLHPETKIDYTHWTEASRQESIKNIQELLVRKSNELGFSLDQPLKKYTIHRFSTEEPQ